MRVKIAMFYHSLISDWSNRNAGFLRGVVTELLARAHDVTVYEPRLAWSVQNLVRDHGEVALTAYRRAYPGLSSIRYDADLDLDRALDGVDLAIVHEWNDPALVARIGHHRARGRYHLLFHDTHHRSVTAPADIGRYDLRHYDGVLAFGKVIRDLYLERRWARRAWTWHEAADTRVFHPHEPNVVGDLVWIGNWGEDERTKELREMLIDPVAALELRARVHGVRYPTHARLALAAAGISYGGWLPNYAVPTVLARFGVTVHVPRRPYVEALPGIPTIRVFEALACGIPLVCAPWRDDEGLFTPGKDYLVARDGDEMKAHLLRVLRDRSAAAELASHGLATIRARHTCAHRVDELVAITEELS